MEQPLHYPKERFASRAQMAHQLEQFVAEVFAYAIDKGASDIHFEPYENKCLIRLRIDGFLMQGAILSKQEFDAVIGRIKILAQLDITEKRLPQDGRLSWPYQSDTIDVRVSTCPVLYGEKCVCRLLYQKQHLCALDKIGLTLPQQKLMQEMVQKPQGLIIICGPTGSGKTMTLYALLLALETQKYNILSIEDPVEMAIDGINQVPVHKAIGFDFQQALKAFLRQDPDIMMIGELRDRHTAQVAIEASLTGHLVLCTLHTNSAVQTIDRLSQMGVESYHLAHALKLVVAQRLVRRLCPACKSKQLEIEYCKSWHKQGMPEAINTVVQNFHSRYSFDTQDSPYSGVFQAKSCPQCHLGYRGQRGIFECLKIDQSIAAAIEQGCLSSEIYQQARARGLFGLEDAAVDALLRGETSLAEITRVIGC